MFLFWMALSLLVYLYFGYPILAWTRAKLWPRAHHRGAAEPTVTVIVVAHDEEHRIGSRLDNLLSLDYPREKLEILLASDGSTDGTVERARQYGASRRPGSSIREAAGKPAVLNDVVPSARGEIVVLADARQRFERDAIRALVANFADPLVGAVGGELMLTPTPEAPRSERARASTGVTRSSSGEAKPDQLDCRRDRRDLRDPADTVRADSRRHDSRRCADSARDHPARLPRVPGVRGAKLRRDTATSHDEFIRKVRTIAGTHQLFARERWLFDPLRNPLWFETMSHKALRLAAPFLQLLLFAANFGLADLLFYRWLLAAQIVFYAAALGGHAHRHTRHRLYVLTVPYALCVLNWAAIVGFVRFLTGQQRVTWEQVASTALASPRTRSLWADSAKGSARRGW